MSTIFERLDPILEPNCVCLDLRDQPLLQKLRGSRRWQKSLGSQAPMFGMIYPTIPGHNLSLEVAKFIWFLLSWMCPLGNGHSGLLMCIASLEFCLVYTWRWSLFPRSFQSGIWKLWTLALETEDLQTENACAFQDEAALIPALACLNSLWIFPEFGMN